MSRKSVLLLLPGYTLSGDDSQGGSESRQTDEAASHAAFSFSEDHPHEPWQARFSEIVGLDSCHGKKLPTARLALTRLPESSIVAESHEPQHIVRADPVFFKADRDSAKLLPANQLHLSNTDADELLQSLNDFVSTDGYRFFRHGADEWYMSGKNADLLESFPPFFIANRNASTLLPTGEPMASWRRLMTELQMLLHTHPVNQQRESMGLMPVNSVWFWGGAALPARQATGNTATYQNIVVFADDAQAVDLAQYFGINCQPLSALVDAMHSSTLAPQTVVLDDTIVQAWLRSDTDQLALAFTRINQQVLAPLVDKVRTGELQQLTIVTEDGLQGTCSEQTVSALDANARSGLLATLKSLFNR